MQGRHGRNALSLAALLKGVYRDSWVGPETDQLQPGCLNWYGPEAGCHKQVRAQGSQRVEKYCLTILD